MLSSRRIAARALKTAGWEFEGEVPMSRRFVCTAFPHTSNWDGLILLTIARSVGLELNWMVKKSWVEGPQSGFFKGLGAVPIDRSKAGNVVEQMVRRFATGEDLVLTIPPEGTRSRVDYWKSGFYQIALGAGVPVVPGYLDYATKRGGLGPEIEMTGDVKEDMGRIREFYEARNPIGHKHEDVSPIRLRAEEEPG